MPAQELPVHVVAGVGHQVVNVAAQLGAHGPFDHLALFVLHAHLQQFPAPHTFRPNFSLVRRRAHNLFKAADRRIFFRQPHADLARGPVVPETHFFSQSRVHAFTLCCSSHSRSSAGCSRFFPKHNVSRIHGVRKVRLCSGSRVLCKSKIFIWSSWQYLPNPIPPHPPYSAGTAPGSRAARRLSVVSSAVARAPPARRSRER